jgi:peptidoglycan-associated lipoprotein
VNRIENTDAAAGRAATGTRGFVRSLLKLAAPCGLIGIMAACSSVALPNKPAPIVEAPAPAAPVKPAAAAATSSRGVTTVDMSRGQALAAAQNLSREPADRSVFFDFDKSMIKTAYDSVVEDNARFLASHPSLRVVVQGNTDERGSAEYNLALGQARADSVAKEMELVGVRAIQVSTVSFGAEKPKATGHDESAWSENRRADIVYGG